MFNTAPIMEWHNTTLLCYFMDFYTLMKNAKVLIVKIWKQGAGYRGFMDNLLILWCGFCAATKHFTRWDFGLKSMDFWAGSIFGVKIFILKKVINIIWITQNNMWITFCLKTYLKTKFPTRHTKSNKNKHLFPTCNPKWPINEYHITTFIPFFKIKLIHTTCITMQ